MTACEFPNRFEPFYCRVHHAVRTSLDKDRCNGADPHRDDAAIERLVDAAIRRGDISESRGAEILGLRIREWRSRARGIRTASPETPEAGIDVERLALFLHANICYQKTAHDATVGRCWALAAEYARLASREEGEQ